MSVRAQQQKNIIMKIKYSKSEGKMQPTQRDSNNKRNLYLNKKRRRE